MKHFMEVNPQLFDDCSHEYTETQNNADINKRERQAKWDKLSALAKNMQNGASLPPTKIVTGAGQTIISPVTKLEGVTEQPNSPSYTEEKDIPEQVHSPISGTILEISGNNPLQHQINQSDNALNTSDSTATLKMGTLKLTDDHPVITSTNNTTGSPRVDSTNTTR